MDICAHLVTKIRTNSYYFSVINGVTVSRN